MIFKIKKGN